MSVYIYIYIYIFARFLIDFGYILGESTFEKERQRQTGREKYRKRNRGMNS